MWEVSFINIRLNYAYIQIFEEIDKENTSGLEVAQDIHAIIPLVDNSIFQADEEVWKLWGALTPQNRERMKECVMRTLRSGGARRSYIENMQAAVKYNEGQLKVMKEKWHSEWQVQQTMLNQMKDAVL